jgi:glycosyltransferase involved in cell wall biosynthesis
MKVSLISPWKNAWVPYYKQAFEKKGFDFVHVPDTSSVSNSDIVLHAWSASQPILGARNLMFLRRYELFSGDFKRINWKNVDTLVCVNSWIKDIAEEIFRNNNISTPVKLIYNGTDLTKWKFRERKPGNKIGMACHIHPKKNLSLAMQILSNLPQEYELHIAGEIQDPCTAEYLNHIGKAMERRVYIYGHIPSEEMDFWWEQHNYCLSTSLSEGNPNNVIEAMAKGIKPVIHNWPGSQDQFPKTFTIIKEAVEMIKETEYSSSEYRDLISRNFSLKNIDKVVDLCTY